jgi:hypothetical protein
MKLIVDGKAVEFKNDVKVLWDDESEDQLQLTATHEGIILDTFELDEAETEHQGESFYECKGTASLEIADLEEYCH